jgi:hypothetical protein
VESDDPRVIELGGDPRFTREAFDVDAGFDRVRMRYLEGDDAMRLSRP